MKYVVIGHHHFDHVGGLHYVQTHYNPTILMGKLDWDVVMNSGAGMRRGADVLDGQKLTLGDTTIAIYVTPGHTDGTLSFIFPVKDKGQTRVIAYPGGTAYNFPRSVARFQSYIDTQKRFTKLVTDAGASVVLSNHSEFDMGYLKARMLSTMMPGEANPFVIKDGVQRYQTVLLECAEAEKARLIEGYDIPSKE